MENQKGRRKLDLTNEEKLEYLKRLIQRAEQGINLTSDEILERTEGGLLVNRSIFSANSIGKATVPSSNIQVKQEASSQEEGIISSDSEIRQKAKKIDSKMKEEK